MPTLSLVAQHQIRPAPAAFWVLVVMGMMVLVFLAMVIPILKRFKRCPSNRVLVIFGRTEGHEAVQCVRGGMRFVMPLIQDYAWLSLEPTQVEIPLRGAVSADNIRVHGTARFNVAIGTEPERMQNAAARLLGLDSEGIGKQAEDIIRGQLYQVIASVQSQDIYRHGEKFVTGIRSALEAELGKIGLELISVIVTEATDESRRQPIHSSAWSKELR